MRERNLDTGMRHLAVCMSVPYPMCASVQPYPVGCNATRQVTRESESLQTWTSPLPGDKPCVRFVVVNS